jgi:hypothetical protein
MTKRGGLRGGNTKQCFYGVATVVSVAAIAGCVLTKPSLAADGDNVSRAAKAVGCELGGPWAATLQPCRASPVCLL